MRIFTTLIILAFFSCTQSKMTKEDKILDLSGHHLKIIPDSVFEKKDLTDLYLGSSSPTFFPPLSALVDTNANEITEIPEKIGELKNLKTLILNSNRLSSLPNSITKLTNLEVLDLSINKELDIIKELEKIKSLPNLKTLMIVDTKLTRDNLELLRSSLNPDTKVVLTISEYFDYFKK